jgi:hypothetical protein
VEAGEVQTTIRDLLVIETQIHWLLGQIVPLQVLLLIFPRQQLFTEIVVLEETLIQEVMAMLAIAEEQEWVGYGLNISVN